MTTNTDVLISILQGGADVRRTQDALDGRDAGRATSALSDVWRQQPSYFVASNDLLFTSLRIHIESVALTDGDVRVQDGAGADADNHFTRHNAVPSMQLACQLRFLDEPLTPVVHTAICARGRRCVGDSCEVNAEDVVWFVDEWLVLPLPLSEVPLDAVVHCTLLVANVDGDDNANENDDGQWVVKGVAHVFPFASCGELRTGTHVFPLASGSRWGEESHAQRPTARSRAPLADPLSTSQLLHTGRLQSIPWLDLVTAPHLSPTACQPAAGRGDDTAAAPTRGHVQVTFPMASNRLPVVQLPLLVDEAVIGSRRSTARPVDVSVPLRAFTSTITRPFVDHYNDMHHHDWSEAVATLQARSLFLAYNTSALPDYRDRQRLLALLQRPPVQLEPWRVQDTLLLWQYREFIRHDARYFLPFMRSVPWRHARATAERRVAEALIPLWKPIGFADTLACLSIEFYRVRAVRAYAVGRLAQESDARLTQFAVPLLQAIVLDDPEVRELGTVLVTRSLQCWELCSALFWAASVEAIEEHRILTARRARAAKAPAAAVAHTLGTVGPFTAWRERQQHALMQHQPQFLALLRQEQRAQRWLRALATQLEKCGGDRTFKIEVGQRLIEKQGCGLRALFDSHESVARDDDADASRGGAVASAEVVALPHVPVTLPTHPAVALHGVVPRSFFMFKSATMPFRVSLVGSRLSLRASADGKLPCPHDSPPLEGAGGEQSRVAPYDDVRTSMVRRPLAMPPDSELSPSTPPPPPRAGTFAALAPLPAVPTSPRFPLSIMYKWCDDVRQDQLVLQLIGLMDAVLRLDGLDLCLTPYSVVATGPNEGLVEIVPDVVTFQSVQKDIRGYLRRFHRTAESLEQAMARFTQSFAGYSIITFVLGIGDRHLENILLAQDGRLLHIDFAFMLGHDPKPFAPPMKINAEMIEALGGPQSRGYHTFRSYCCSAYHALRKHASLLLYTIQLMLYANGMPQLTGSPLPLAEEPSLTPPSSAGSPRTGAASMARADGTAVAFGSTASSPDPRANVLKVQEKLRLDLTNAQATQFLQNIMADSVGSLFTNLWDVLHAAAQATRA